jgi:hypothetical protein
VRDRDLDGLFALVPGELENGPRKAFVESKSFEQLFDRAWVEEVLEDTPSCGTIGGNYLVGPVWYYGNNDEDWHIFSINSAVTEPMPSLPAEWVVRGEVLRPKCMTYEWLSSDNFEAVADYFEIEDYEDFSENTGKYIGLEITSLAPINGYSLVNFLSDCMNPTQEMTEYRGGMRTGNQFYRLLFPTTVKLCRALAPSISGMCLESYLVVRGGIGGSMGWHGHYSIYGLFVFKNGKMGVAPLKNFDTLNLALNFIKGD